ncbi:hypothetical protein [Pseudonocardia sp. TRM90224]|uniref:hypothetical protein n=1 Tax=Pseudonocardia sp. TRM90224 TaxID=2812678 RepID=UPI001E472629|nr:hypothetical protein [Pseudonocardia sp. TRM90224]
MCRRAAEYELNRAQGLLRRAEQKLQDARLKTVTEQRHFRVDADKVVEFWEAEVDRLRVELRRLLEASEASSEFLKPA